MGWLWFNYGTSSKKGLAPALNFYNSTLMLEISLYDLDVAGLKQSTEKYDTS